MKTYKEFSESLSEEQKEKAKELYDSVKIDGPPLMCFSDRASDSKHWKKIELTPEQEAEVQRDFDEGTEKYKSIAHIICEGPELTDEQEKMFEKDLEEEDVD